MMQIMMAVKKGFQVSLKIRQRIWAVRASSRGSVMVSHCYIATLEVVCDGLASMLENRPQIDKIMRFYIILSSS